MGTATVGRALANRLMLDYRSTGEIFREQALKAGLTVEEYSALAETNSAIDIAIDDKTVEEARQRAMVLEGRLTGWLTHRNQVQAFRVWLEAPLEVRLERIGGREGEEDLTALRERVNQRQISEQTRYREYYDIDLEVTDPYDVVLDTSRSSPGELVELIVKAMEQAGLEVSR